jgi:hypothetical protein
VTDWLFRRVVATTMNTSPVIFICGATGCGEDHQQLLYIYFLVSLLSCDVIIPGKTEVSIKLAQELQGEVINADAYQLYKGLDIATAKITKQEVCSSLSIIIIFSIIIIVIIVLSIIIVIIIILIIILIVIISMIIIIIIIIIISIIINSHHIAQMQGVPHHLLSLFNPKEQVNVTDFVHAALQVCQAYN